MEDRIKERFNSTILEEALRRYGVPADRARLLDSFESFMYEVERDAQPYILRIGHSLRRSEACSFRPKWIGSTTWPQAAFPWRARSHRRRDAWWRRSTTVTTGSFWQPPSSRHRGDRRGTSVGVRCYTRRMDNSSAVCTALSRTYRPANPAWQRPHWDEPALMDVERLFPVTESTALQKYRQVVAYLRTLPQIVETYGLIHQDAHGSNFFVDEAGHITLFDFDDCAYSLVRQRHCDCSVLPDHQRGGCGRRDGRVHARLPEGLSPREPT